MPQQYTPRVGLICGHCRTPFTVISARATKAHFCSNACKYASKTQNGRSVATCSVCHQSFDVDNSRVKRGASFCSRACYFTSIRKGDIAAVERFWSWVSREETCWVWRGFRTRGYGQISYNRKVVFAHRFAWWIATGIWPTPDQAVCHDCPDGDDPGCVRNDEPGIYIIRGIARPRFGHLWLGTQQDNVSDMVQKGRQFRPSLAALTH